MFSIFFKVLRLIADNRFQMYRTMNSLLIYEIASLARVQGVLSISNFEYLSV